MQGIAASSTSMRTSCYTAREHGRVASSAPVGAALPQPQPNTHTHTHTLHPPTCISDSMALSLATAMVRPSGSNEAWLTQLATMALLAFVWAAVTM